MTQVNNKQHPVHIHCLYILPQQLFNISVDNIGNIETALPVSFNSLSRVSRAVFAPVSANASY
jgi:hypothetical protein